MTDDLQDGTIPEETGAMKDTKEPNEHKAFINAARSFYDAGPDKFDPRYAQYGDLLHAAEALAFASPTPDTRLLNMLRDQCWDLRSFDVPTGGDDADVAWRVVSHWQAEPREREVAVGYSDDPRIALRTALASLDAGSASS